MRPKAYRHGCKLTAVSVVLLASLARAAAQAPNPELQPYVGDWVGQGWGWEERFRQSAGEFVQQFPGAKSLPGNPGTDQTVMSLFVRHVTHYYFRVDERGNVTGEGEITYDLFPNLCGVAALTKQVNEQVNMMSRMASIFKLATNIGSASEKYFNAASSKEESMLAEKVAELERAGLVPQTTAGNTADNIMKQLVDQTNDAQALVSAALWNDCFDPRWRIAGTVPNCLDLLVRPTMKIGSSNAMQWVLDSPGSGGSGDLWQSVFNTSFKQVLNVLKDSNKKSLRSLDLRSEQEAAACSGTGNALVAGTQVGPANLQELALQMVPAAAGAAMDTATMSPPTSLLLSIPGLTQVQYYYKGLTNGPESRDFKLKGHVVPSGKGAKIYLEMVGDVTGGDKQLYVEYMVNYKKEVHPFPTWSPFLDEPADAQRSGIEPIYTQSPTLVQTKSGPVAGKPITGRTDLVMAAPFATLHETGSQRNGVKAWHGYEYTWNAWKVMEPIPGGSTP